MNEKLITINYKSPDFGFGLFTLLCGVVGIVYMISWFPDFDNVVFAGVGTAILFLGGFGIIKDSIKLHKDLEYLPYLVGGVVCVIFFICIRMGWFRI